MHGGQNYVRARLVYNIVASDGGTGVGRVAITPLRMVYDLGRDDLRSCRFGCSEIDDCFMLYSLHRKERYHTTHRIQVHDICAARLLDFGIGI